MAPCCLRIVAIVVVAEYGAIRSNVTASSRLMMTSALWMLSDLSRAGSLVTSLMLELDILFPVERA